VATDPQTDVAVLKVTADGLTAIPMGDSRNLQVGEYVVAIGNPFGVGQTATFGIISALGRTGLGIERYENFIQTDAAINPGNSGGALVDMSGRLVGINTAIISRGGGNVGIGFAIPIDMARAVTQQLIADGRVSRGALGVTIQDLTPELALAMGVRGSGGAVVSQVTPQSAGARAGLREGDVVVALNDEPIMSSAQLRNEIGLRRPGTVVRLTLFREGQQRVVSATLDTLTTAATAAEPTNTEGDTGLTGMTLSAIPRDDPRLGRVSGVYVVDVAPGSDSDDAGIQEGDIITAAGRMPVSTPAQLERILRGRNNDTPILVQVRRGEASLFVALG
jgi:Do/DeqQ family serine protease